jgi:tetratricopeptide (TPR) repeat protein
LDVFVAPPSREQSFHPVPTSVPAPEEQKRSMADVPRPSVWNIPYPRNPFFTGRDNLLAQLTAAVQKAPAALTQPHAISGLGGIGKTQVAVEYAYRSHADYQAVLWVRADTRENIVSDFVTIAGLLELPEKDEQDQLIAVQAVKKWLRTHSKWLLIFDNADELVMLREFLPPMPGGHLLLTTRAQAMGRLAQRVEVEKLEVEVGALFLLRRAALLAPDATLEQVLLSDREAAIELTREMDGLPLAMDQAGAYIEETSCRVGDYLRLYRQQRGALLARRGGLVADHPASVSTTWSLSFEQVEQRNRAAADLLRVCAFLHPDAIPEALLAEGAIHLGPQLAVFATDELAFNEAISALHAYSLVRRDLADKTLSLHRLVQAVLKDAMSEETQQLWAERVVRAVDAAFPEVEFSTWQRCQACLPHALACVTHLEQQNEMLVEAASIFHKAGVYLLERGRYEQAEELVTQAVAIRESVLEPEHVDLSSSLDQLATIYQHRGRYEQAEPLFQRALAIREKTLGPDHPHIANTLHNLASLNRDQGNYKQAEPLYQRALAIFEKTLGPEHPGTATTLYGMAYLSQKQGRNEQAESFYQRALAIYERALPPDHPVIAGILGHYASLLRAMNRPLEVQVLEQRANAIQTRSTPGKTA